MLFLTHPSVQDNFYGDLLLVTCSSALPSWIKNDEISANRTFISEGKFHFIPRELLSSKKKVQLIEALAAISSPMTITTMNKEMHSVLTNQLASCDAHLNSILECGTRSYRVLLPKNIASILLKDMSVIPAVCDTYNSHVQSVSVKEFSRITKQHDDYFALEESVEVLLPLTKKCFALLHSQSLPSYVHEGDKLTAILGAKLAWGYMVLIDYIYKNSAHFDVKAASIHAKEEIQSFYYTQNQEISIEEVIDILHHLENPMVMDRSSIKKLFLEDMADFKNDPDNSESKLWDDFSENEIKCLVYGPNHTNESVVENGEDDEYDTFFCCSDDEKSDGLDYDKTYDEFEVLDTLLRDPELLMKAVEKCSLSGESTMELLSKLSKLALEMSSDGISSANEILNSGGSDPQLSSDDDAFWE